MHVVVVTDDVPIADHNAMRYTFAGHVTFLQEAGHRVTCCLLMPSANGQAEEPNRARRLQALMDLGVDVVQIPSEIPPPTVGRRLLQSARRMLRPAVADFYLWASQGPKVQSLLERLQPDVLFLFTTYQGIAATHGMKGAPRFALLGDPEPLPAYYRQQVYGGSLRRTLSLPTRLFVARNRLKALKQLLSGLDAGGAVAAHHAEWFRRHGFLGCDYVRNLVPDLAGPDWRARRDAAPARPRPKIILVGHLRGTATLAGLYLFAQEVLPRLERRLGPEGFEAHVIGCFQPPADLARKLSRPAVRLRGLVDDIEAEHLSADVFLSPTPIPLGVRTRILFAWSFGCCVIAHRTDALGIPEMRHGENAMLADDGPGLAEAIIQAVGDASLRDRLGARGRETFERWFAPDVAGRRIVEELERLARRRCGGW